MSKKGQALVEFVLILPVLIFILLAFVDISKMMIMKNHLETVLNTITADDELINDKNYDIQLEKKEEGNYTIIELKSCINVITPGINKILGNPACATTSKRIEREI